MANRLNVPPDLLHLIEKRERKDRREAERRAEADQRQLDLGPLGAANSLDDLTDAGGVEQRSGQDRRKNDERRQAVRLAPDQDSETR